MISFNRAFLVEFLLAAALLTGCQNNMKPLDKNNIDPSVRPQDDFYHYAAGNWIKNNPIPKDRSAWGSFTVLSEDTLKVLREIMENSISAKDGPAKKIGDFYAVGMDEKKIEAEGIGPIAPELLRIGKVKDLKGLCVEIAHMHQSTADPLFILYVAPDFKKSDINILHLQQGGLNLPDRDYYLKNDPYSKDIREKYVQYLSNMFRLLGCNGQRAGLASEAVIKIETRLAKISKSKTELRDPRKNYHPMTVKELSRISGKFDWRAYFNLIGCRSTGKMNVGQTGFFEGLNAILNSVPIADWRDYLAFCLINKNADSLSSAFVNEDFDFYGKKLSGAKEIMPRWKRVVGAVNAGMDEAVGQLFVDKMFSPRAKARAIGMVRNIRAAFGERIKKIDWMSEGTKTQALHKLDSMTFKIGYPDKWKDYSKLEIKKDSYFANAARANRFEFRRELNKVGKKVDKNEWQMPAQVVNAGYVPLSNEMIFPAGILQPPFFNAEADDAVNYGAIGTVIAHEMTHGFDDQGKKFDAKGNMKEWWTKEDEERFKKKTRVLVEQFAKYEPFPKMRVNGELTLGENIADLGGVQIAFEALKGQLNENAGKIDGLTPKQRFFLSYAQIWRMSQRDERGKMLLKIDPHSPAPYRVNGPLSNITDFYEVFDVIPSDKMFRPLKRRARVW